MYTEKDIEVITSSFEDTGLEILYSNLKTDAGGLLLLSKEALVQSLYQAGYATDYDVELIRIPMPTDQPDEGVYNWITLDDFINNNSINGNLDESIAINLVLHDRNNSSSIPKTTLP